MSRVQKIASAAGGALLLVVAVGVFLPATAHVERSQQVAAHPATVFALLNDFHQIDKWSNWRDMDPNARYEISGPRRGVGARIDWSGAIAGTGSQTIIESVPYEQIASRLVLDGTEVATSFRLAGTGAGTEVTWTLERDFGLDIFTRYFGLLFDRIHGADFEAGLVSLKSMAESLPPVDFSNLDVEHVLVESVDIALMPTSSEPLAQAISEALGDAYFRVLSFIDKHGLREAGAPMSISRAFSGAELRFDAGVPVRGITDTTPRSEDSVQIARSYGGPVIRVGHIGSYVTLGRTHDKIAAYMAALGIERNGDAWESYVSDPTRTATEDLLTYVYYPIRQDDFDGAGPPAD